MTKKLFRSQKDKMIAGVCGGLAEYFEVDATIIRLIFVLVLLLGGSAIVVYLILWLVLPKNAEEPIALTQERVREVAAEIKDKAQGLRDQLMRNHENHQEIHKRRSGFFGWILIVLGFLFLINSFLPEIFRPGLLKFWPLLLVLIGVILIARPGR